MVTDPIADLLTRMRNAQLAGHSFVTVPASRMKQAILQLLLDEGFIARFDREENAQGKPVLKIFLRYDERGRPVIKELTRVSRPGRRIYVGKDEIPLNRGGLGVMVVSTSRGMLSDHQARKEGIGGELICSVF